jgi:hypothetical protein
VVLERQSYDEKMGTLLNGNRTYEKIRKPPFKSLERKLNERLLDLKKQGNLDDPTYKWLHSTDALPPSIRGSVKHHKIKYHLEPYNSIFPPRSMEQPPEKEINGIYQTMIQNTYQNNILFF